MNILDIAILIFVILETSNVCILYFAPDSKLGNGVAVFNAWSELKEKEDLHLFARYMTCWVAGTKLIFIVLLLVIVFVGNEATKIWGVAVMIASIATYYWKLNPIMIKLDSMGCITPKGYSKTLFAMITVFCVLFAVALGFYLWR